MRTLTTNNWLRNTVLAAVALVAVGFAATTQARSVNANSLTFSRDVALPGVVLPAGTYVFEIANPDASNDVVRVRSKNGHVLYMGFTLRTERPAWMKDGELVTFKEARSDTPLPIAAWYPIGTSSGHQFLYR